MSFIEALFRLRFLISLRCFVGGNLAKRDIVLYSFNTAVADNGLCEPYLEKTNSSFSLRLSESKGMFKVHLTPKFFFR